MLGGWRQVKRLSVMTETPRVQVEAWTSKEVVAWLALSGFADFVPAFEQHAFTGHHLIQVIYLFLFLFLKPHVLLIHPNQSIQKKKKCTSASALKILGSWPAPRRRALVKAITQLKPAKRRSTALMDSLRYVPGGSSLFLDSCF
jgi:hypothetical protein